MTETLLLDQFLPAYDHVISVSQVFRAPPEAVFEAAVTIDLRPQLVYGTVTKPWRAPYGTHACILTLETRVAATDDDSRRRFQRYWRATGPFIRMIRPSVMRTLHQQLATVDRDRRPDQRRS